MFLAEVLPRHSVTSAWLWQLLLRLLKGGSTKAAVEALAMPFSLEALYHLLQRLRGRLPDLRSMLCRQEPAPVSSQPDPLLQTVEHFQVLFSQAACALKAFQLRFQKPLLG